MDPMSAADVERVELGQPFKLFPQRVKEVRSVRRKYSRIEVSIEPGPSVFYGLERILSAPPLPDLLFRAVLGHSLEAHTTRDKLRLWIEADQDFLTRSGLILQKGRRRLLNQARLPGIGHLRLLVLKEYHGTYESWPDETLLSREIRFGSFVQMTPESETGPHLTANPFDPAELALFEAKFTR